VERLVDMYASQDVHPLCTNTSVLDRRLYEREDGWIRTGQVHPLYGQLMRHYWQFHCTKLHHAQHGNDGEKQAVRFLYARCRAGMSHQEAGTN
jgi:hypothetical protein